MNIGEELYLQAPVSCSLGDGRHQSGHGRAGAQPPETAIIATKASPDHGVSRPSRTGNASHPHARYPIAAPDPSFFLEGAGPRRRRPSVSSWLAGAAMGLFGRMPIAVRWCMDGATRPDRGEPEKNPGQPRESWTAYGRSGTRFSDTRARLSAAILLMTIRFDWD